ncbi:MAG: phosphoribosylanthranilate isomerase [bacterium]
MHKTSRPKVKICCISSLVEARMAISHGADAIGLVSEMPSGPGIIPEEQIAEIAASVPPGIKTFLLTSKQDTKSIIDQQLRCGVTTLQLVDRLENGSYRDLQDALPGILIVQVVHVLGRKSIEEAESVAPFVDAVLLDSGNPRKSTKELGGTGRTHNWKLSKTICERLEIPIYLAGGLTTDNVSRAVQDVGPYGLDVCSGVRTNGRLDESKLAKFFAQVRC